MSEAQAPWVEDRDEVAYELLEKSVRTPILMAIGSVVRRGEGQVEFLDMVIDSLTETGFVDPATFYESPFTDFDDMGIAGIFDRDQTKEIIRIVQHLNEVVAA